MQVPTNICSSITEIRWDARAELRLHGMEFDLDRLLQKYQMTRRKNEVNKELTELATKVEALG